MRKRLKIVLMKAPAFAAFLSLVLALAPVSAQAGDANIVASREDGRLVFTNEGPATSVARVANASTSAAPGQRQLVYWSNTEHRYKPVPHASLKAARSALEEVNEYLAAHSANASAGSAAGSVNGISSGFDSVKAVDAAIEEAARRHNLDPNLVRAVIKVESNFNPHAISRKGAMGLMQLMPTTARQLNVTNPFDPQQNVDAGVRHLKKLLQDFGGNVPLSLAAYNAGTGAVQRSAGIPHYRETRNYVNRITTLYNGGNVSLFPALSGPRYSPVRVTRDAQGALMFSNTD